MRDEILHVNIVLVVVQTNGGLQLHVKFSHKKDFRFNCAICQKSFFIPSDLKSHTNIVHGSMKEYACDKCNKGLGYGESLKKHMVSIHGEESYNNYPCNICDKKFGALNELTKHLQKVHHEEKKEHIEHNQIKTEIKDDKSSLLRFKCEVCLKYFQTYAKLDKHKNMHSGFKPYECTLCGKYLSDKYTLKSHILKIHSKMLKTETIDQQHKKQELVSIKGMIHDIKQVQVLSSNLTEIEQLDQ